MKFPKCFLSSLRCINDAGPLLLRETADADDTGITNGNLYCETCSRAYPIQDGILRLMAGSLTEESQHEIELLNQAYGSMPETFEPAAVGWRSELNDQVEIAPHLDGLQLRPGHNVLEIGCGDGRYTVLMSQLGGHVLAFDFCIAALKRTSKIYPREAEIMKYLESSEPLSLDLRNHCAQLLEVLDLPDDDAIAPSFRFADI